MGVAPCRHMAHSRIGTENDLHSEAHPSKGEMLRKLIGVILLIGSVCVVMPTASANCIENTICDESASYPGNPYFCHSFLVHDPDETETVGAGWCDYANPTMTCYGAGAYGVFVFGTSPKCIPA